MSSRSIAEEKILESRLERAVRHVTDYWIPVNPTLMNRVRQRLDDGTYDTNIEFLLSDIRGDLSLFSFCLLKIMHMMRENGDQLPGDVQPFDLLRQTGVERLKEVLALPDLAASPHSLEEGGELQLGRLQDAFVSASTTEVLAQSEVLDAEGCYAAALLRQLGITLIAWNYPAVYQEAIQSLENGETLDQRLAVELGFSPSMLAIKVFLKNGAPARYCGELGLYEEELGGDWEYLSAISETTIKLCKIGEALARARSPELYPNARDEWKFAKGEIEERLGSNGMKVIHERLQENLESLVELVPHIFRPALILDLPAELEEKDVVGDFYNPYLSSCLEPERQALTRLYRHLTADVHTGLNIKLFRDEVLPATGFSGGCVFTVDTGLLQLVPQLEFGKLQMRTYDCVEYSLAEANNDLVAVAFRTTEPVVAFGVNDCGDLFSMIAGVFGCSQRYGVFYLEMPGVISEKPCNKFHFQALQHALNDCLSL